MLVKIFIKVAKFRLLERKVINNFHFLFNKYLLCTKNHTYFTYRFFHKTFHNIEMIISISHLKKLTWKSQLGSSQTLIWSWHWTTNLNYLKYLHPYLKCSTFSTSPSLPLWSPGSPPSMVYILWFIPHVYHLFGTSLYFCG